jgi:protein-tyrosine phosphatase
MGALMLHLGTAVARRYGRKQGLLRHGWFLVQDRLGLFRGLRAIDWGRAERLVFVCQGNVCRSPYAEARARALGVHAASFGLRARHGHPAHDLVARLAAGRGLDLAGHRAVAAAEVLLTAQDVLIGLEPWHARCLTALAREPGAQVSLLGLWGTAPRPHIEDPFGLGEDYFRTCLQVIDDAVGNIVRIARDRRSPSVRDGHGAVLAQ